jgi:hypothetical protein
MTEFVDNLPLDGEVYVEGDVRVYIYRGYHCQDVNQCVVGVKGKAANKWVERSKLTPLKDETTTEFRRFPFKEEAQRSKAMTKARRACEHIRTWERGNQRDPKAFSWRFVEDERGTAYVVEKKA